MFSGSLAEVVEVTNDCFKPLQIE